MILFLIAKYYERMLRINEENPVLRTYFYCCMLLMSIIIGLIFPLINFLLIYINNNIVEYYQNY
jgi:uncharacterized membrane protein (DUF106 family)